MSQKSAMTDDYQNTGVNHVGVSALMHSVFFFWKNLKNYLVYTHCGLNTLETWQKKVAGSIPGSLLCGFLYPPLAATVPQFMHVANSPH